MDPHQQRALDALQPFIALSKSATSPRAAADLVMRATSAPNTYIFAELLSTPNIQSLRQAGDEYAPYLTLLEIFSWGTWHDYNTTPNLPRLNDQQTHKLRLLSLLTLCTSPVNLNYTHLQTALSLSTPRQLEDLIIGATYAGLLGAKLSPSTSQVHILFLSPLRDLAPGSIPQLLSTLTDWDVRCGGVLTEMETQIKEVRRRATERRRADEEMHRAVEKALQANIDSKGTGKRVAADVAAAAGGGSGGGGGARADDEGIENDAGWEGESMDVDDGEGLGISGGGDWGTGGLGAAGRGGSGSIFAGPAGGGGGGQRKNPKTTRLGGIGRRGG